MKMTAMKMAMIMGGLGFMGYMYLMNNPDKVAKMKRMGKDMSKKMYNMLDSEFDLK